MQIVGRGQGQSGRGAIAAHAPSAIIVSNHMRVVSKTISRSETGAKSSPGAGRRRQAIRVSGFALAACGLGSSQTAARVCAGRSTAGSRPGRANRVNDRTASGPPLVTSQDAVSKAIGAFRHPPSAFRHVMTGTSEESQLTSGFPNGSARGQDRGPGRVIPPGPRSHRHRRELRDDLIIELQSAPRDSGAMTKMSVRGRRGDAVVAR